MSVRSFCLLWRVRVRVLLHGACGSPARRTDGDGITAARQLNYRAALGAKGVLRRGASCADDGDTESRHGAGPSSSGAQDGLAGGDLPFFVQDATNLAWNKESRTSVQAQANQDFLRGGKGGLLGWAAAPRRLLAALPRLFGSRWRLCLWLCLRFLPCDNFTCHYVRDKPLLSKPARASIRPCACLCIGRRWIHP